jgi:hypothetical protein
VTASDRIVTDRILRDVGQKRNNHGNHGKQTPRLSKNVLQTLSRFSRSVSVSVGGLFVRSFVLLDLSSTRIPIIEDTQFLYSIFYNRIHSLL